MALGMLDAAFAEQRERLTPFQLATIREWQRTNRFYERIQALHRGTLDLGTLTPTAYTELQRRARALDDAIASGAVPRRLTVYRGIRSVARTFGTERAQDVPARDVRLQGLTAASAIRDVAATEFVGPNGALLELDVPAGTPALWVAGVGDPSLRRQGEVLFRASLRVRLSGIRHQRGLAVLSLQVIVP